MKFLIYAHLFAIAFIAAPSHQGASQSNLARAIAATPPPPSHQDATPSNLAAIVRPPDVLDAIIDLLQEPRDRRAVALAFSKAHVSTKDTNDIMIRLSGVSERPESQYSREYSRWLAKIKQFRKLLDRGVIYTSASADLDDYDAIEGKLNARTNKLIKFDTIVLEGTWQNDFNWQKWNWTKARAIELTYSAHIEIDHPKLPMSRLNNLKEIYVPEFHDFKVVGPLLTLNPGLESLSLFLDPGSDVKEIALATCAMKQLKTLIVRYSDVAEFAAEYMKCLPDVNPLEKLVFYHFDDFPVTDIATTPEMIEKLHLKQFSCDKCQPEWAKQTTLEQLVWGQFGDPAQNVNILTDILKMKSLVDLKLAFSLTVSPKEFELLHQISLQVKKMKIEISKFDEKTIKKLPGFSQKNNFFFK